MGTPRILVADDSGLLRRMVGDVLRQQGWIALEAPDGKSALALTRAQLPDVLLLAREMEGLDGLEVLEALVAHEATSGIPVVFVTGHTDALELADGLERGAHDYVRKPVDPVELVARVRTALRLRALRDELAQRNAELELLARTDWLTGLVNRRCADEHLRGLIAGAARHDRELAVVLVDVDCFKAINDHYGHAAGDEVLKLVSQRLATGLRVEDIAARWGGEEFLLVLPDAESAGVVAERLRAALAAAPLAVSGGISLPVTASFGWASWIPGETPETLVARADAAMYAAKEAGRNCVVSAVVA